MTPAGSTSSDRRRPNPRRTAVAMMDMPDPIELDPVEALGAVAVCVPGDRSCYLQALAADAQLTVLVEKEQVALLATEAVAFLDRIADDYPEDPLSLPMTAAELHEPTVPLF